MTKQIITYSFSIFNNTLLISAYFIVGDIMIVQYTSKELDLLARLMRAEALGEGDLGMLMVGNVVVNRTIADCLTFKNNRTITDTIYQSPGGFAGVNSNLFFSSATTLEKNLAERVLRGEYFYPATNALWFYAPSGEADCVDFWYEQELAGRYKGHCFYQPDAGVCPQIR